MEYINYADKKTALVQTDLGLLYKSFNDDFLRKNKKNVEPKPWEKVGNDFYPYIEVSIEEKITTIVGANESGKSHLLSAIEKSITGQDIERSDFCRYSPFFTVKRDELKYPDFGTEWSNLSDLDKSSLREIVNIPEDFAFERLLVFRKNIETLIVYLPANRGYQSYKILEKKATLLNNLLPKVFKIKPDVALPPSVPINILVKLDKLDQEESLGNQAFEFLDREQRNTIVDALNDLSGIPEPLTRVNQNPGSSKGEITPNAVEPLKTIISTLDEVGEHNEDREKEFKLAYKLICTIAQVDSKALLDLAKAIKGGMQGYANGIIENINHQLSINFNFPNYWVQDRNFSLRVMARDYDLVFTITDRTGTEYSFDERSQGLRYFLSYYIQYRSHEPHANKSEILLMDEPDAYLSSQAQQDLLNIFDLFANPEPDSHLIRPIQVVYVTHSPFLIDKNHGERIRVLQKGNEDEGTRVVKDVAKNHYEPLRSSIGAYVGETTFIGNCNLMVEGLSDQIIIAGVTSFLHSEGDSSLKNLNLNQITIVPSGSASHIPYLVYLARGRDVEKPAVIVLLDSDKSGNEARKQLLGKGGQHRRPLLKEQFILQLSDLSGKFSLPDNSISNKLEIEDLVPIEICVAATKLYLEEFCELNEESLSFLTGDLVSENISNYTMLDAIEKSLLHGLEMEIKIDKVGFSRDIIRIVNRWSGKHNLSKEKHQLIDTFKNNFRILFEKLNEMQRQSQRDMDDKKLAKKIDHLKKDFTAKYRNSATREKAFLLLEDIEAILDTYTDSDSFQEIKAIKDGIKELRFAHKLDTNGDELINDYDEFKKGLERVKYAGLLASQVKESNELRMTDVDVNKISEEHHDKNSSTKGKTEGNIEK